MDDLLAWLKQQNGGVGTYIGFQQRALQLASEQSDQAALYQLLAALSGRFISSYDAMPLPAGVAKTAFARLTDLTAQAAESVKGSAEDQLRLLNEIAQEELG